MIAPRRLAPLPLLLAGLAVLTLVIALTVHAQSQEVTPTRDATGANPPAKPTNLQASAEHDSVTLTWTASTDQTVTHYAILRRNPDVDASQVFHVIESNAGPGTSYTDNSVSASTTYIYRVKSVSPTGVSQWSGYVKAETPAAPDPTPTPTLTPTPEPEPESTADDQAPTNLAAALAEGGGVTLTWTAPSDDAEGVTGYEILRAVGDGEMATLAADTESTTTTYTDATATDAGETYAYQVKAIRGDDRSQASGQAQVQAPHDPVDLAPSNLTAALADGGGVNLSWSAPAEDADSVTGYEILRAVGGGEFTTLKAGTGATVTADTDTTATDAGETYAYQVKAIRGEERSQASGQAEVQLPHDPEDLRPTGLTVSLVENKVSLSWAAPAEDAESVDGYEILRRRPMEGESALATLVADTESTATTYTDATANEPGVRYVYRVKALRGDDVSLSSNFDKIDLPADYVPDPTPTPEPESTSDDQAPTGLTAALADGGGVTLTWTAPAEDADSVTGYEILRAVGDGDMAALVADTASTTTSYTDTTATEAGETYAYQVKAIRGEDRSQASGQAQVQLPHDPVDLAPTGLTAVVLTASVVVVGEDSTATATASTFVSLSWTAPAEDADSVTGYEILRAVGEGDMATLVDDTGNTATSYTDATATQSGTSYTYKVKAIRGEDRSQASGQAQVQLPHDPVDLAPSDLTAAAVDGGGVDLSWSAPAEDAGSVTGYEVLRAVGEGEMATLAADTASTTTTYTDATATGEGETYAYRVKAIRGQARSQASNRVSLIPVEPPATPENLAPSNLTFEIREDGVTLAWDAPATDADSVTGYRVVRRRPNQGENEWLVWKWDTGSTETTYRDGYARTYGEFYMYRVRALRGDDYSKMSNRVDVRRPETTPQTAEWAPSNLKAYMYFEVALGEEGVTTQVKLTWDAPAEGVEWVRGYEVQRATCDGDFTTLAADTGSTDTAYTDATAEAGESYTYRVRARRPQGLSLISNTWTLLLPGGTGESDCAVPLGAPETEPVKEEDLTYALSQHEVPGQDFNTLDAAGNDEPQGLWSDGTTMWVADYDDGKIYAYNLATKARDSAEDFNTLDAAGNDNPWGLWSDGTTMWVVDYVDEEIYAYNLNTKARVPGEDFNSLHDDNVDPWGIWSDGTTIWVADWFEETIFAYDMDTKDHLPGEDFNNLREAGNNIPSGLWADETTIFVADWVDGKERIYAYWRSNKAPNPDRYITLSAENDRAVGIWSDGTTMWVADESDAKLYAYALPDAGPPPDTLSVEHVTDTMALVKVDIGALVSAYPSAEQAISVHVLGTFSSATMYVHADGGYARFLLLGLRPETQYTVIASYGVTTSHDLGDAGREVFRTDYASLAGIEPSGLTHTEATVTVSLNAAGLDRGCCFRFYPHSNKGEAERDYTFYLRHKPSDEGDWSDPPVRLTFSDFAADVRLTGLDPDTAYDVEVAETADFMPPQGSAGSYQGTLTVGNDQGVSGIGFDQDGYSGSFSPYGSISPTTFALGGVDHSIVELNVGVQSFLAPGRAGKLFLTFDRALPDGIEFTLTLGTAEFNSSDATVDGQTYSWAGGPSWSNNDSVTVELDFTGTVPFREGTTLEGSFSTPPLPETLAFEAEMTVGTGTSFDGYDADTGSPIGSISPGNTFEVGGIQYTVEHVGFNTGDNEFDLSVSPALPFDDSFTLTLAATQLPVLVKNTGQSAGSSNGSLTTNNTKRAQSFTTGTNADGYTLGSIGIVFYAIGNPSNAGSQLTVTLNDEDNDGNPDSVLCTLSDPATFSTSGLHTFSAPTTCPKLAASTTYFAVIERANATSDAIRLNYTVSSGEDAGGAVGWSIADNRRTFSSSSSAWTTCCDPQTSVIRIEVRAPAAVVAPLTAPSISIDSDGVGQYTWSGTNPNWASGAMVDVKLEVPLINICARSPAVAHAIKSATPSFDYCHMTSPIDLAGLTDLDLPNGKGTGLKVGDFAGLSGLTRLDLSRYDLGGLWPQLPVGVFDGLDSLTHLDISHTHLMSLDLGVFGGLSNLVELDLTDTLLQARYVPVGVFDDLDSLEILRMAYGGYQDRGITFVDEDIFRGLDTLRELDVRPIRPPDDVLAPLTSLETLNGQGYTP